MSFPRIPQAVVFDMDGLLFDTEALYRDAMIAAALRLGFEMPEQVFLTLIGLPPDSSRARLLDHYGSDFDVDTFWGELANGFHQLSAGRSYLKAGVTELLAVLDQAGLRSAIATSSRHQDVQRNLTAHDLGGRFHFVVAHGDYALGKPNPDPFLKAAEKAWRRPRELPRAGRFVQRHPLGLSRRHDDRHGPRPDPADGRNPQALPACSP